MVVAGCGWVGGDREFRDRIGKCEDALVFWDRAEDAVSEEK